MGKFAVNSPTGEEQRDDQRCAKKNSK